jgi:predicted membrane chloride channel (bestrophin family)
MNASIHAEARLARSLWHEEFVESRLNSVGFWESLPRSRKLLVAHIVNGIIDCLASCERAVETPEPEPRESPSGVEGPIQ